MDSTADLLSIIERLDINATHDGRHISGQSSGSNDRWLSSLYGKVLVTDRPVRFKALQNTLLNIWARFGIISISPLQDDIFLAEFGSPDQLQQVLHDGPWNFNSDLILMEQVLPNTQLSDYCFDSLSIWVQIHNVPINLLTPHVIADLLEGLGDLQPIDPLAAQLWKSYARVRSKVKTDFKLKDMARSLLDNGHNLVAILKYERVHRFCITCCSLGHDILSCTARKRLLTALQSPLDDDMQAKLRKDKETSIN